MEDFEVLIVDQLASADCVDAAVLDEIRARICDRHDSIAQYLDSLLNRYIQLNYLGPVPAAAQMPPSAGSSGQEILAYLETVCGEAVFAKARDLHCLALCQFCADHLAPLPESSLFAARLICLLQGLLAERSPALHARLMRLMEASGRELFGSDLDLEQQQQQEQQQEERQQQQHEQQQQEQHQQHGQQQQEQQQQEQQQQEQQQQEHQQQEQQQQEQQQEEQEHQQLQLEHKLLLAQLCLAYFEGDRARRLLAACRADLGGLTATLGGAAGVRTRFQRDSHAQLYLAVSRSGQPPCSLSSSASSSSSSLPRDVAPTDDTLLPTVRFTDPTAVDPAGCLGNLTGAEQACLLLCADLHRRTRASDGIVEEELLAYANALLVRPVNWCVATAALLRRSRLELGLGAAGSTRRLERALQQLEELSGQVGRPEPDFAAVRRPLFYASCLPPVWQLEADTADALVAVGAVGSALEVYLRWDRFSEVIACYQKLEKPALAEKIVRQRLAEAETPELYCALAEVTRDWTHLHTAWRISKGRCSRAARSLGYVAMVNGQYDEAMRQFELSLAANHLQPKAWFTYGCCCLQAGAPGKAELAFRRSAQLEPDNYEAWTNLGTAMVRQGNKAGACAVLREALKSNWENWRVWDNYLAVCADVGHFAEAVRAFHRLLDLRPKFWDPHSARALVRVVAERLPDARGDADCHVGLRPQLLALFGRLAAQASGDAEFWWLQAELLRLGDSGGQLTAEAKARVLQSLQRCHRCDTQAADWYRVPERRDAALTRAGDIAQRYIEYAADCRQSLLSARLMLNGLLARQQLVEAAPEPLMARLRRQLELLDELMQRPG